MKPTTQKTKKRLQTTSDRRAEKSRQKTKRDADAKAALEKINQKASERKVAKGVAVKISEIIKDERKELVAETVNQREVLSRKTSKNFKRKRFFITAAELGAEVDADFMSSVESFVKETKSELVILPLRPHTRALSREVRYIASYIDDNYRQNIHTEYVFNERIKAVEIYLNSQQTNPVTGLHRLATEKTSIIVGHSKQQMKTVPTGHSSLPKLIHSTGVITKAAYRDNRQGRIANKDHVVGGLVLEINGDNFHIRTVRACEDGSFVDINRRYRAKGKPVTERAEALVLGDYHGGYEDEQAENFALELLEETKPKRIFFHDFFDACSVSHHRDNSINQHLVVPDHLKKLEDELSYCRGILKNWTDRKPKDCQFYMVASNHPEHLERYLDEGRYIKDRRNYKKAIELAYKYHCLGINPIQEGIDPGSKLATWLTRDSDMRVEGVMVSAHGDKGVNGTRGSARSTEFSYGDAMVGHSHSPEILHQTFVVGTLSKLKLDYNVGPSGWLHACGLIHKGGGKQLIISIDGKWKL